MLQRDKETPIPCSSGSRFPQIASPRRRPCISLDYASGTKAGALASTVGETRHFHSHSRAQTFKVALPTNSIRVTETSGSLQLIKKMQNERETERIARVFTRESENDIWQHLVYTASAGSSRVTIYSCEKNLNVS